MNIIADENLAFTDYFFSEFGKVEHRGGRHLQHKDVKDADALIIRSVTQVNHALIDQTPLKFVGSATIGTDHMDITALEQQGITWTNAPGCNAQAVAEYVITALLHLKPELLHQQITLGIVGLGNVGRRLTTMAKLLDWRVIGYDPYVQLDYIENVSFEKLLQDSHAISIHVPLTKAGDYPTYHLFNEQSLRAMPRDTILINSARGPVVEELALMNDIQKTKRQVALDVFEHEPLISAQLLDLVGLVTPHIAGYSLEGKARGTQMVYQAFCQHFGFKAEKQFESQLPLCEPYFKDLSLKQVLQRYLSDIYDIQRDDQNLRACVKEGKVDQQAFDRLRKEYPLRREWAAHGGPLA
ncbi:4-phosphoerythronate dehydrogenase [Acinetobacter sp. S40]|uniref:4-phosphoerythronate dehydrogenase n=1 Tax=Acinetobacter sp. S40 TaxID=2767434 RepID=UPI00190A91CF|nr:4-phosphoerythronate dehydrogenase [Acinetobacter sp. S40]MBJ9985336.1 4-phosphoerythronate dehydrogenase [Acinetobacter sp. S40]